MLVKSSEGRKRQLKDTVENATMWNHQLKEAELKPKYKEGYLLFLLFAVTLLFNIMITLLGEKFLSLDFNKWKIAKLPW